MPLEDRCYVRFTKTVNGGPDMTDQDWSKPAAMAIPKEGYFELERGRYGPVFPRTPACYGFSIIAKVKEGREEAVRAYGKTIEESDCRQPGGARGPSPALPPVGAVRRRVRLALPVPGHLRHRLRQVHRGRGAACSVRPASPRCSPISKASLRIGRRTQTRSSSSSGTTRCPSFLEYGEYPYVTADEIKKALRLKAAFSDMLDQMQ